MGKGRARIIMGLKIKGEGTSERRLKWLKALLEKEKIPYKIRMRSVSELGSVLPIWVNPLNHNLDNDCFLEIIWGIKNEV